MTKKSVRENKKKASYRNSHKRKGLRMAREQQLGSWRMQALRQMGYENKRAVFSQKEGRREEGRDGGKEGRRE